MDVSDARTRQTRSKPLFEDRQAWLTDTLARNQDHKINRIDELLPWNYIKPRDPKQRSPNRQAGSNRTFTLPARSGSMSTFDPDENLIARLWCSDCIQLISLANSLPTKRCPSTLRWSSRMKYLSLAMSRSTNVTLPISLMPNCSKSRNFFP